MTQQQAFFRKQGYPVCRKIGEGGFGEVYHLKGKEGVELAAKLARKDSDRGKYLSREALMAKHLEHPIFPRYYNLHEADDMLYLLMEYIEGENLARILRAGCKMDPGQVRTIGRTMAEALSYIHLKGYVYRDLKPGNLILQKDGTLRLVDLGCVVKVDQEKSKVGSAPFAAPEQLTHGVCRPECDIYSWGMVMKHLVNARMEDQLKKLIKQCTETEPGKRFPDAEQLAYVLTDKGVKPRFVICQNIWKNTCRFEEK